MASRVKIRVGEYWKSRAKKRATQENGKPKKLKKKSLQERIAAKNPRYI